MTSRDLPHQYTTLTYNTAGDAARIVTELMAQARTKPVPVTVLHDLSGITGHYTDHLWGWTLDQLKQFEIKDVNEGFEVVLPEPRRLELLLDQQIERLHGPGAVEAIEKAYADGSLFGEKSR